MREFWTIVVLVGGTLLTIVVPAGVCLWMLVVAVRSGLWAALGLHGLFALLQAAALVNAFTTTRSTWWSIVVPPALAALQLAARYGLHIPGIK